MVEGKKIVSSMTCLRIIFRCSLTTSRPAHKRPCGSSAGGLCVRSRSCDQ
ncbi:unnamed protein product [Staurois parvus]|uniref:Uncharacterized protein n=1 Tax=Staurois parvus TaxID=386267 RepID=A0ABN9DW36_9NEOB|nr:unnamed protein product [Staurois parvus]